MKILNQKIFCLYESFAASIKITVDGGTNRWLYWLKNHELEKKLSQPDFITGDFDSCKKESFSYFNQSQVVETPDQNATDFTKSIVVMQPFIGELGLTGILALSETSGRVDHIIANINTLCINSLKPACEQVPVYILSSNNISWLLTAGSHNISIPEYLKVHWCSLVPLQRTTVTTTGLKWNLNNDVMELGGMVSTSNTYDSTTDTVTVTTDKPLLWSMGISKIDDE